MNIAVNTRLLIKDIHGGIEWFAYETLSRITRDHPEHRFFFIFDHHFDESFLFSDNIEPVVIRPQTKHPLLWYWWHEVATPPVIKKLAADLYLSPGGMIPLRTEVPCLPVIHDINFHHRTRDLPIIKSYYYRRYFPMFARKASRIATVSEYSKNDMIKSWGIDPGKIDVVYNGASDKFYPENGESPDITRKRYSGSQPYFLFVGNLSPRKNVPNVVRAFNLFRRKTEKKYKLLIAGNRFFLNSELNRSVKKSPFRPDILFTGSKSQDDLRYLYCASESLLFVPWFEGFGIPVVEAMRCGTPVITSDRTSLPEVAGGAALLADPSSPEAICDCMVKVTSDKSLKEKLITIGIARSSEFTWERTADLLWRSIEKVIKP